MKIHLKCYAGLLSIAFPAMAVSAAEDTPSTVATTNDQPIVVTATRTRRQLLEVPASVSVVGEEKIAASAARNVEDCLRQLQGVHVMQVFGMSQGMPSRINMRGVPGEQRVLVLVDGLPLNEISTRFTSINEIPLNSVGQVEVIRGPFSSLYGTDAFAGVVNVITRTAPEETGAAISMGFGNHGYWDAGADVGGSAPGVKYLLDFETRSIDNYLARDYAIDRRYDYAAQQYTDTKVPVENYDYTDTKALGKVTFDLGTDSTLAMYARYFQSELGYGRKSMPPVYETPEDNITEMRTMTGGGMFNTAFSTDLDLRFGGYYRHQIRELWGLDVAGMNGEVPVYARSKTKNIGDEWQIEGGGDLKVGSAHTVSAGVELRRSDVEFKPLSDASSGAAFPGAEGADGNVTDTGVFAQDEIKLTDDLKAIAGLRLDHSSEFGSAVSPRASTIYRLSDDTTLRASVGRAFRAPTLVELFQPPLTFGYFTFVPNPDLKPEYIWSTDAEIEHRFSSALSASLSVFYNDMKDLVANTASGNVLSNDNIDKARSAGIEAAAEWKFTGFLSVAANYTYQDAKDKETDGDLEFIPENSGSISLNLDKSMNRWRMEGSLVELYMGKRGVADWATGGWFPLDEYWRTDMALKTTYDDTFWVKVGIQNLTDEEYQESLMSPLAPGRMVVAEAGARY